MRKNWKKIMTKGLNRDHYTADVLILWCSDNRGKEALEKFILENKFRYYDLIMVPGGAKSLVEPNSEERQTTLNNIKKLLKLHKAKRIILTTHIDCGAYGGSVAFNNNAEVEHQTHEDWLKDAQFLLLKYFSNISVEIYFVDFEGIWQIV